MESLEFYNDHADENEEPEEDTQKMQSDFSENEEPEGDTQKMQPDFSVNEVEIEEVTMVVETQELEVEEVEVVTFQNNANHEEGNLPFNEGRSNAINKDLNEFEEVEEGSVDPSIVPEAEEGLHAPDHVDEARELVDLNRETCEADLDITASRDDVLMTEDLKVPLEVNTEAIEDADEDTETLQNTELVGKHALTFGEVANGHQPVEVGWNDTLDMEAHEQQPPLESASEPPPESASESPPESASEPPPESASEPPLESASEPPPESASEPPPESASEAPPESGSEPSPESASEPPPESASEPALEPRVVASDGGSAEEDPGEALEDLALDKEFINKNVYEKETEASEHAHTERELSALNLENVNDSDNANVQAGNPSAPKENRDAEEGLESASDPKQLFNDENLAQLRAQILVMGLLRKGSKPSSDLLKSACPASIEGISRATVVEDAGAAEIRNPLSSKKRKSHDNQAVPSGSDGIATDLMNSVKDNLRLSHSQDALLLDDTDRQLRLAQVSAHDAMATATSALAQSHLAWAQIRGEDLSEIGIAREVQIASVAATVAAAASVAKAAVEAAKAIANVSLKACTLGGQIGANEQPSAPQSKKKSKSSSARNRKSDMLDSVIRAAGMAAEAATQAGTVLAFTNPLLQAGASRPRSRTAGAVKAAENKATRAGSKKTRATPKRKATKMSKGHAAVSPKRTSVTMSKDGSKKNDVPARGKTAMEDKSSGKRSNPKTQKDSRQPALLAKSTAPHIDLVEATDSEDTYEKSKSIARGSTVEIMTDEVGLRGGWFSGKVLRMAKGQAFVVYDEILNDDGSKLEEWFPFNASGDPAGPRRQVRPVHPYSLNREAGSKKRRRVAMGSQTWTVGDHVDGFVQDAWWEGILVELNDIDESKATVYFPGENDTQTVKVWNLRPSMLWEDGKWAPWMDSTIIENERLGRQGKVGSSRIKSKKADVPKVDGKVKKAKKSLNEIEALSHEVDESLPPRSTRKGEAQNLSAKAPKSKKNQKKYEDSDKKVNESTPSRSTRQSKLLDLSIYQSTEAPKAKKSSKNPEVPINEVHEPLSSRSSRKRKGLELISETKKGKKDPMVLVDLVVEPTPTRSTRSSLGGKKLDDSITARDSGGRKSNKVSSKERSGGKNTKLSNKAPPKDVGNVRATKKLDLNVDPVTLAKTTKKSETLEVPMIKTRGKLKAEMGKPKAEEPAKKRRKR